MQKNRINIIFDDKISPREVISLKRYNMLRLDCVLYIERRGNLSEKEIRTSIEKAFKSYQISKFEHDKLITLLNTCKREPIKK